MDNQNANSKKDFKFCQNCGAKIDVKATFCPKCGVSVSNMPYQTTTVVEPKSSLFWWGVLGFFLPIVGWILYFVFHKEAPQRARYCAFGAWIGILIVIGVWFAIILFALFVAFLSGLAN